VVDVVVGGRALMPDHSLRACDVVIDRGKISSLVEPGAHAEGEHEVLDATGCVVSPGFIDTHVHGAGGYSFMEIDGGVSTVARHLASAGVTACAAATATTDPASLAKAVEDLAGRPSLDGKVDLLGIHLEGPFLAETHRGVHRPEHLRPPTETEVDHLLEVGSDRLRIVTLAPELRGAHSTVRRLVEAGVTVALGHSAATYDDAVQAFSAGVSRVTHCFNALPPIHHRAPGPIVAALADPAVYIELVGDGRHVAPEVVRWTWQQVGPHRLVLVSDGVDVAGLPDGQHRRWEGTQVVLQAGVSRTLDGDLAGGAKGIAHCVRDLVRSGALPLADALVCASETPARSLGVADAKGRILPGQDADLVVLAPDLELRATVNAGNVTHLHPDTSTRPPRRRRPS
jgi:N-acetylglucosamine-6-phosphate deacetylase